MVRKQGLRATSKPQFGADLKAAIPTLERKQRTSASDSRRIPYYEGVGLLPHEQKSKGGAR
jgi:hypothetical protein